MPSPKRIENFKAKAADLAYAINGLDDDRNYSDIAHFNLAKHHIEQAIFCLRKVRSSGERKSTAHA